MANPKRELPSQEFIEQKITKQVTILAGAVGTASIDIPREKTVFLKGYGYTWFTLNSYKLSTGNTSFPKRSDQEGSPAIPVIFGTPFKCRSGGKLSLGITNNDVSDHTYDVVFYIVTQEILNEESTGGDLNLSIGGATGTASSVAIVDSTGTTAADVTADGMQVYTTKALPAGTNTIGDVTVSSIPVASSPATIVTGQLTATTSAAPLGASTTVKKVTLRANSANTDKVLLGNSSGQTFELMTGESIDLEIDDIAKIYVLANSATQKVDYIGA